MGGVRGTGNGQNEFAFEYFENIDYEQAGTI